MNKCACTVLAAGASTRLGSPKQLLRLDGETLLHRAARLAFEAGLRPVFVVLGSNPDQHAAAVADIEVVIVLNTEWHSGMSSSLRAGITSMMLLPEVDHVLVLVCDQLAVTPELISELLDLSQKEPGRIIASFYRGRAGVPCIFPRPYFEELTLLHGDYGARPLLQKYASELRTVPFPAGELDIDTPEDVVRSGLKPFA